MRKSLAYKRLKNSAYGNSALQQIDTEAKAKAAGYTKAVIGTSQGYDALFLVKPETDLSTGFVAWNCSVSRLSSVIGSMFVFEKVKQ